MCGVHTSAPYVGKRGALRFPRSFGGPSIHAGAFVAAAANFYLRGSFLARAGGLLFLFLDPDVAGTDMYALPDFASLKRGLLAIFFMNFSRSVSSTISSDNLIRMVWSALVQNHQDFYLLSSRTVQSNFPETSYVYAPSIPLYLVLNAAVAIAVFVLIFGLTYLLPALARRYWRWLNT
jgi:hypothetical protein